MKVGVSGNEILKTCLKQLESEGIAGRVHFHPIGDWGHSAGTLVGNLHPRVANVRYGLIFSRHVQPLRQCPDSRRLATPDNTYYSVELYAQHFVPEHNTTLTFYLEEDIYWVNEKTGWDWVYGQQKEFHFVKPPVSDVFRVQEL